ncbi:hypothetical protein [Listeria seeligeri]|uniref:hypothetical protein n=1 Tax=Listeria seeligeri TaxID=1640 RepID=UPI001887A06B|nr:hypothetical protein [Listeria seeligeri]MBF2356049.1 hypothetical protein [Listeria seeligeri]
MEKIITEMKEFVTEIKNFIKEWILEILYTIVVCIVLFFFVYGVIIITFGESPSDKEAKTVVEKYVDIQLADEYTLDAIDYETSFGNRYFTISYIGSNKKTGKKKEVMEEKVGLGDIESAISKDKKKGKLEKEVEKNAYN